MQIAETDTKSDTNGESDNEIHTETLVHGLIESQHNCDLWDKIIELMLVEGKFPLGISRNNM